MRVLLTTDTAGGVWMYTVTLAGELERRGVRVTVAAMGPEPPPETVAGDVRWRPFTLEWMPEPWDDVAAAGDWLLELAEEIAPDVVHVNGFAHAALPWRAPVLLVAHSDVLTWWHAVRGEPAPPESRRYRSVVEEGLRAADLVVAPTRAYLESLASEVPFDTPQLAIANGLPSHKPVAKQPYIAAASRFTDEAKNLRALRSVERRLPWPLRIGGTDGWIPPQEFTELLGHAAVFAAPALYEPFGLAVLRAASLECALVLGDIPTLRELWDGAALFVEPRDHDALAAALVRLIDDEEAREDLARRARERSEQYTAERMVESYLAVYERLALGVAA